MRFVLALLGMVALLAMTKTASAESGFAANWEKPAFTIAVLDGWRARNAEFDIQVKHAAHHDAHHDAGASATKERTADPGEELTAAVERMWSQVRVYHRPGGAEAIVRGKF